MRPCPPPRAASAFEPRRSGWPSHSEPPSSGTPRWPGAASTGRPPGLWRAGSTLTYADATGALLVLALPAALLRWRDVRAPGAGLANVDRGASRRLEVGHALAVFVLLTGVLASVSRGALLALVL